MKISKNKFNRYGRQVGSRRSEKDIWTIWTILEENLYDMTDFKTIWLFPGWFQVMSAVSWFLSDSSWMVSSTYRWFRVFPGCSSFYLVQVRYCEKSVV